MTSAFWPWKCPDCNGNMSQTAEKCAACSSHSRENLTSDARSEHDLCDALKTNGQRCRAYAGQGTDHPGAGHCSHHGGNTPAQKVSVARREAVELVKAEAPLHG